MKNYKVINYKLKGKIKVIMSDYKVINYKLKLIKKLQKFKQKKLERNLFNQKNNIKRMNNYFIKIGRN